jgi:hypothetical protein
MIISCPMCASTVDATEALCSDCGWSVPYLVRRPAPTARAISYAERYRGTPYQAPQASIALADGGIAKGRAFVSVALVTTLGLVALILVSQPHP